MKDRDVDLVIHKEKDMEMLITFLVFRLQTIDGEKHSAKPYTGNKPWTQKEAIFRKIITKYKILKFRMKISCLALEKKMTVQELIFNSILKTYSTFYLQGKIPLTMSELYKQTDEMYHRILFLPLRACIEYIS